MIALLLVMALGAPPKSYVIIVAGDKDRAPAETKLNELKTLVTQHKLRWLSMAKDYPQLVDSATVAGLKPGFQIVIAGGCKDKKAAERARDLYNLCFAGSYVRAVDVVIDACPKIDGIAKPVSKRGYKNDWTEPAAGSLEWVGYSQASGDPKCESMSAIAVLTQGKTVLDELSLDASCNPARGEGDLGSQTGYEISVEDGELAVKETTWGGDTPSSEVKRYRATCGGITAR